MKCKKIGLFFLLFFIYSTTAHATEYFPYDTISLKITIIQDETELEWEFINPDEYEWEYGNTVIKDEKAKKEVEKMVKKLGVQPKAKVEDMVKVLQADFHNMKRLDVRWINEKGELFTWVWEKDK